MTIKWVKVDSFELFVITLKIEEGYMEDKTQVVEKRLSRGVIRRRTRKVEAKPEESKKTEAKKVVAKDTGASESKAASSDTGQRTVVKKSSKGISQSALAAQKSLSKTKKEAVEPEKKKVEESPKKVAKTVVKKSAAGEVKTSKEQTKVEAKGEKDVSKTKQKGEDAKNLSFKDRLRGTISLDKIKSNKAKEKPSDEGGSSEPRHQTAKPETDAAKKEKTAKVRRGVKNIGGDLDIEGQGKSTTLTHLVRTTGRGRVFNPSASNRKKKIISKKKLKSTLITQKKASKRVVEMESSITVGQLAQQLGVKASELIKKLMDLGEMVTINQSIDFDSATLIANEYDYVVKDKSFKEEELIDKPAENVEEDKDAVARPPIVTVMGHVDHGKTSLLDSIRESKVTEGEAGGITQHIGAYTVKLKSGEITFLDTPGHEAFTNMRARGAKVTDLVILVVAADDGMMPQTEESIAHAQAAGVPIIVAVNKMDKPEANPEQVMRQLSERGLLPEDWGGDTMFCKVSAHTKEGLDTLLDNVLLQAEMLELKANPKKKANGIVLEAQLDKFRGPVCTLLVQSGTLKKGDSVVVGNYAGKVRTMIDWTGKQVKQAGPSHAVEVIGLEGVPSASDPFDAVASDRDAKKIAEHRQDAQRKKEAEEKSKVSLEDMFAKMQSGDMKELNVILKTDVQGSLEAVRDAIAKLSTDEVKTKVIHAAVGGIKEADVNLAMASEAVIIGFNVRPETKAIHLAKDKGVDVKLYKIIYDLVNDVKLGMQGLLAPSVEEEYLGRAEIRDVFQITKVGMIAGCMVVDGLIKRHAKLRLLRDNVVIHEGEIESLKRFKDDAKEVKQGFECGVGIEGYQDIKAGDVIEAYDLKEVKRTL